MVPVISQLAILVGVAGGIPAKPYDITGIFIRGIHFFSGKILLNTQTGTGKTAPMRNSHTRFRYSPPGPNSRLGPIRPHMTEASKVTRYLGQVQGLSGCCASTSQMFSIFSSIHHATARFTVPATNVPTTWKNKRACQQLAFSEALKKKNQISSMHKFQLQKIPELCTYTVVEFSCSAQV